MRTPGAALGRVAVVGGWVGGIALAISNLDSTGSAPQPLFVPGYLTVGTLVVLKQPTAVMGWILYLFGVAAAMSTGLSGVWFIAVGFAALFGVFGYLLLLFPDGKPRGAFYSAVAVAHGLSWGAAATLVLIDVEIYAVNAIAVAALILTATAPFARYRNAIARERAQLKLIAYVSAAGLTAAVLALIVNAGHGMFDIAFEALASVAAVIAAVGLPVSVGVAVLRHGLFDIDRLISRTLTYAVVTALSLAVFAAIVVVPGSLLGGDEAPPALVAAATLAAAATFAPIRRRVQAVVDRRFDRARYDTQVIVHGFAARLREPRELEAVTHDLASTVGAAMPPDRLGIWVRP